MTAAAPSAKTSALPFVALVLGALAMAIPPTFVRLADVGPLASAFWRVGAAIPVLWIWAAIETRGAGEPPAASFRMDVPILVAGIAFALDLIF